MFWKFLLVNLVVAVVFAVDDLTGFENKDTDLGETTDTGDDADVHASPLVSDSGDAAMSNGESSEMISGEDQSDQGRPEARIEDTGNSDVNGQASEESTETVASTEPSTDKRAVETTSTTKQTSEGVVTTKSIDLMDSTMETTTDGLETTTEGSTTEATETTTVPDDNGSLSFTPSLVSLISVLVLSFL